MHSDELQDSGVPDENPRLVSNELYMPGQFIYPLQLQSLCLQKGTTMGGCLEF